MAYLQKKLVSTGVTIKQPSRGFRLFCPLLTCRMSAIMQGAILHGLGYNLVKERLIRRSYGVISSPEFVPGQHPEERKFHDESGTPRCKGMMEWFVCKVIPHINGVERREKE